MLPRRIRLSRREVSSLLKSGQRFQVPEFTLFSLQAPEFKISVIVPTSLYKKSSARNKLRRAVYQQLQNLPFTSFPRKHWLVILKTAAKNLSPRQLPPHTVEFLTRLLSGGLPSALQSKQNPPPPPSPLSSSAKPAPGAIHRQT